MSLRWTVRSLVVGLIAFVPLVFAQGTYTQIDYPGALATVCYGIDTAGDLVGEYEDASGNVHGFLLSGGTYTTIDYVGGLFTQLSGINDRGQIVGNDGSGVGFVYDIQTKTFTELERRGATYTIPTAINNEGTIAGYLAETNKILGFELFGSTWVNILPPGTFNVGAFGITNSGEVLGGASTLVKNSKFFDFLFKNGRYQPILLAAAGKPSAYGINGAGTAIVGEDAPAGIAGRFLFQNGTMQPLQFPGATYTLPYGINNDGEVTVYFYDSNDNLHGFTWTPPADAARK
jgi:uncharacterized membrane protein